MNTVLTEVPLAKKKRRQALSVASSGASLQFAFVLATSLLLGIAVTRQSLWIDEAFSAWFATYPTSLSMMKALLRTTGSDSQMPLYYLYLHVWVHAFGRGELALRLSNLPCAVVLLASISWVSSVLLKRPYVWLLFSLSPFLWQYMNEARPYVAVMMASGLLTAAVLAYCLAPKKYGRIGPWIAIGTFTCAFGLYMLFAFLVPWILAFLALRNRGDLRRVLRDWRGPALVFSPLLAIISGYYAWRVAVGAGGTRAAAGIKNIVFVLYEFCGFSGLGPPRNELRASAGGGLLAYWPWLALGSLPLLFIAFVGLYSKRHRLARDYLLALGLSFVLAVLACEVAHFRFVGRHFAMYYPVLFVVALITTEPRPGNRSTTLVTFTILALALAWAVSDARMIGMPQYRKDDYRCAVSTAIKQARLKQAQILWAADYRAAYFYGLKGVELERDEPLTIQASWREPVSWPILQDALLVSNWKQDQVCRYMSRRTVPVILVLGKTDLFDQAGGWSTFLGRPGIQRRAIATPLTFSIFEIDPQRPSVSPSAVVDPSNARISAPQAAP
jgi:hypothetical protein